MTDLKMTNAGDYMIPEHGLVNDTNSHRQCEDATKDEPVAAILSAALLNGGATQWSLGYRDYAGYWLVGESFRIGVSKNKKPTPEQIKNTEQMFGWEWVDYE